MNRNCILLMVLICHSCYACKSQGNKSEKSQEKATYKEDGNQLGIDSIYLNLSKGKGVNYKKIDGGFVYVDNNIKSDESIAKFVTKEGKTMIVYTGYPDSRKDKIAWNKSTFSITSKLDPSSIKIYQFLINAQRHVIFTGKAQSASGSGVQVTYFILSELKKDGGLVMKREFESRFGDINNLLDFNKDGSLDYFKIKNGAKGGEYLLTVNSIANDQSIVEGYMLLKYKLNDKFIILEDHLSK